MSTERPAASHSEALCPQSKRLDQKHSWQFDGDDPYIVCFYCGVRHDALTGRKVESNVR